MKLARTFRKIFTIPDIHGKIGLLNQALEMMAADGYDPEQDLLVFLGDMIDRGLHSREVLERIIGLKNANPDSVFVLRGNHETFAIEAEGGKAHAHDIWFYNGGIETLASYPGGTFPEEHRQFLDSLPKSLEVQGFFFSHAPVPREKHRRGPRGFGSKYSLPGEPYSEWELTWHYLGRECEMKGGYLDVHEGPLANCGLGPEHLIGICGHIHRGPSVTEARIFPRYRLLDCGSGCFPSGRLALHEAISGRTMYATPPAPIKP